MAAFSGKAGSVSLTGITTNVDVTSWNINLEGDAIDVTGMSEAGVGAFIGGITRWSGDFEGFATGTIAALVPGATATTFTFASGSTGAPKYTAGSGGTVLITGVKCSASVDGAVKVSCSFQGSGVLTPGVV